MNNQQYLEKILPALKTPMQYKWRVQSFSKRKPEATCVAYIDSRDVMDRLDEVCTHGWHRRHSEIKGNIYAEIGIVMPDGSVQWRMDCGTESSTEKEKGESSDSFKRAAVNWGVGRFLYDLEIKRLPANEVKTQTNWPYVVDGNGKQVWDLSKHINSASSQTKAPSQSRPPVQSNAPSNLTINDGQFKALNDLLDKAGADKAEFCKWLNVPSVEAILDKDYQKAVAAVEEKIRKQSA